MARGDGAQPSADKGAVEAFTLGLDPLLPLIVPGIHFAPLASNQEDHLARVMGHDRGEVQRRLRRGGIAVLALTPAGLIAGYGWLSFDAIRIYELHLETPIPPGHGYIWDCLTLPEYRGRHIFPGLLRFMLGLLRQRGIVQAWGLVAPGNTASLHSFDTAGFRLVAHTAVSGGRVLLEPTGLATPSEVMVMRDLLEGVSASISHP
jgi:ribosomal protein S18 acetylase RimI-like enzyme